LTPEWISRGLELIEDLATSRCWKSCRPCADLFSEKSTLQWSFVTSSRNPRSRLAVKTGAGPRQNRDAERATQAAAGRSSTDAADGVVWCTKSRLRICEPHFPQGAYNLWTHCAYRLWVSARGCIVARYNVSGVGGYQMLIDFKSMSLDELWSLHEFVAEALVRKISAETTRLDQRLRQLRLGAVPHNVVFPKYRNPAEPSETWAGRGRQPRWLAEQLKSGKRIDDFRTDLATA
jgi:DNA-binding protein H-NS